MILPDVNILLYAFRSDASRHMEYRQWLLETLNADTAYGVSPQVLCSVMRISTNRRVFVQPSQLEEVVRFCRLLTETTTCTLIEPGERHWEIFLDLCLKAKAKGNLVQDAWFAALAIESGCEWITTDGDYAKFPGLQWRKPFS